MFTHLISYLTKSKFLESCVFGDRFHRIHVERRLKLRFQRKRIACGQGDIVGVLCFRLRQSVCFAGQYVAERTGAFQL